MGTSPSRHPPTGERLPIILTACRLPQALSPRRCCNSRSRCTAGPCSRSMTFHRRSSLRGRWLCFQHFWFLPLERHAGAEVSAMRVLKRERPSRNRWHYRIDCAEVSPVRRADCSERFGVLVTAGGKCTASIDRRRPKRGQPLPVSQPVLWLNLSNSASFYCAAIESCSALILPIYTRSNRARSFKP